MPHFQAENFKTLGITKKGERNNILISKLMNWLTRVRSLMGFQMGALCIHLVAVWKGTPMRSFLIVTVIVYVRIGG